MSHSPVRLLKRSFKIPSVVGVELRAHSKNVLQSQTVGSHFYLQRRLHGGDGGAGQRLGLALVPAVSLSDAQEEHAGGQTSWQRQGHVAPEVCSAGSRSHGSTADESATLNNSRPTVRMILPTWKLSQTVLEKSLLGGIFRAAASITLGQ